jgi:hypothetical protein
MANPMSFQQQLNKLRDEFRTEIKKNTTEIEKIKYEGRKTRNELMKLKHSLTYRDMAGNCRLTPVCFRT